MKPVLKRAPAIKLHEETGEIFSTEDYRPISLEVVTFQIVLSKILHQVMNMKAANVKFKDVVDYNRKKRDYEVQNFFLLQEVFGVNYEMNFFDPSITPLSMQRRKMQKDMQLVKLRLKEQMAKLEEQTNHPEVTFGQIYVDIKRLAAIINKVVDY